MTSPPIKRDKEPALRTQVGRSSNRKDVRPRPPAVDRAEMTRAGTTAGIERSPAMTNHDALPAKEDEPSQRGAGRARMTIREIRDAAWNIETPLASTSCDGDTVRRLVAANTTSEHVETRDRFLNLICRPLDQRERMRRHWKGDTSDIAAIRTLFGPVLAGEILNAIACIKEAVERPQWYPFLETAIDFVRDAVEQMQPSDAMERMLIEQSLWLHARVARLSVQAARATGERDVRILNEAADRVANTYRRHMQALRDYRSERRPRLYMGIGSAQIGNVIGQQTFGAVRSRRGRFHRFMVSRRVRGSTNAIDSTLPAVTAGKDSQTGEHLASQAVASHPRADHTRG
jgi:hypothetical protein